MVTNEEEKLLFHQDHVPRHMSIATMAKLHELHLELVPQPSYISRPPPRWQLAVWRPQMNALGKEIWLQWRNDIRNSLILRSKANHSTKKALNCLRSVGISVSPKRETLLRNKVECCQKVDVLFARTGTYWGICYTNKSHTYMYTHTHTHTYGLFVNLYTSAYICVCMCVCVVKD